MPKHLVEPQQLIRIITVDPKSVPGAIGLADQSAAVGKLIWGIEMEVDPRHNPARDCKNAISSGTGRADAPLALPPRQAVPAISK